MFDRVASFRTQRQRLALAIRRGRVAVLDIGTSKITCLILKLDSKRLDASGRRGLSGVSPFGAIEVVGARTVQSSGIRQGEVVDMSKAASAIRYALLNAEKMAANKVKRVDHAIIGFSGGRPRSFSTVGEVETETGRVTDRDISRALGAAPCPPLGEERQILHAQPVEISVDRRSGITDPRDMIGRTLSIALHVMAVDKHPLANLMECIRQCDLDPAGVISAPYASALSALVEDERRTGTVCIDMGGGSTSMSVFLRDRLICTGQARFGGEHVTTDIAGGLLMQRSMAERIKTRHGGVIPTDVDDREMIDAPRAGEEDMLDRRQISRGMLIGVIRPRIEETLRAVREQMTDMGVHAMPGCSIVLTGAACQIPGIDDLVARYLGRRPRIGRPLRIAGLPQALCGPECSTAVGLAMHVLRPDNELWDFEAPRPMSVHRRANEMLRWLRTSW